MSDSNPHSARLLGYSTVAQDTLAFEIERPAGFVFEAGQFVSIQLPGFQAPADGSDDGERMLSIASAPHDARLLVAMRMRPSPFKRQFADLPVGENGARIHLSPAMGDLLLPADKARPIVMIAGGIGITPFYSMLRDLQYRAALGQPVHRVTLLNGNRCRASTVWFEDINAIARTSGFLRVVHAWGDYNRDASSDGHGCIAQGPITADLIRREVPDAHNTQFYVVGPTAMVATMQDALDELGVPSDQVFIEFFAGY